MGLKDMPQCLLKLISFTTPKWSLLGDSNPSQLVPDSGCAFSEMSAESTLGFDKFLIYLSPLLMYALLLLWWCVLLVLSQR